MAIIDNPLDPGLGGFDPPDTHLVKWRSLKPIVQKLRDFDRIIRSIPTGAKGPRPFELVPVAADTVQVTSGRVHFKGNWVVPTWLGGDAFDTNYAVTGTETLQLRFDIDSGADDNNITADAIKIGWDVSASYEGLPSVEYDIDFSGTAVVPTSIDSQIVVDIAEVTVASGKITSLDQIVDFNYPSPWNLDIARAVTAGTAGGPP